VPYVFTLSPSTVNTATVNVDRRQVLTQTATALVSRFIGSIRTSVSGLSRRTAIPRALFTHSMTRLSTHRGGHYLSAVGEYLARQVNTFAPSFPDGYFHFSNGITSLPGIVDTGDPLRACCLVRPILPNETYTPQPSYFRNSSAFLSVAGQI